MAYPPTVFERAPVRRAEAEGNAVVFEDVAMSFESNPVLDGISFRLALGETKAIFGVAGAGKSTIQAHAGAAQTGPRPNLRPRPGCHPNGGGRPFRAAAQDWHRVPGECAVRLIDGPRQCSVSADGRRWHVRR